MLKLNSKKLIIHSSWKVAEMAGFKFSFRFLIFWHLY